tara:strand:+ start:350 stop:514 length:165 start_codon:yes stop_codon:yes gene_type:complete
MMVKYPEKFTVSELNKLSIEELSELEDALWEDRKRVMSVVKYKKLIHEELEGEE